MIQILEPRYRDMTILVAYYKLAAQGFSSEIEILRGPRKGKYIVSQEEATASRTETLKTKSGKKMLVKVIPLEKLISTD